MFGGIWGREYCNTTSIDKCYNKGKIEGNSNVAGLAGQVDCWHDDVITIKNSYNIGEIKANTGIVSGIVVDSNRDANLTITNVYNTGIFTKKDDNSNITSYAISRKGEVNNAFFLNICNAKYSTNATSMEEKNMKKSNFVEVLNGNLEKEIWGADSKKINDGYPILNWE